MPNLNIRIPSDREPLVDLKTGRITSSWFLFLMWVQQRVGGPTGDPIDTSEELIAAVEGLLSSPALAESVAVEALTTQINEDRERITQLERLVQDMRAGSIVL